MPFPVDWRLTPCVSSSSEASAPVFLTLWWPIGEKSFAVGLSECVTGN